MGVETSITGREIVEALGGKWRGDRGRCLCPAHADRSPSLDVREAGDRVLIVCRSHCPQEAVIESLRARGLWAAPSPKAQRKRRLEATLRDTSFEAMIAATVAGDIRRHVPFSVEDLARVAKCAARCRNATAKLDAAARELRGRACAIAKDASIEASVVHAAALSMATNRPLSGMAYDRLVLAVERLSRAVEMGGRHVH